MGQLQVGRVADALRGIGRTVREQPELLAGVVLAVVLLVGLGWLVHRYRQTTRAEDFQATLAAYDSVDVLMHTNPDPDAMSCALATRTLAEAVDTETRLLYPGQIRHQENRAFETVLDVQFERLDDAGDLAGDAVVLVDHNEARGFDRAEEVAPVAVVDHHPGGGSGTEFTDVRSEYGSCAAIFAEYFQGLGWYPHPPDADHPPVGTALPSRIATGLLYGIQTDTKQLTSGCSTADFVAAEFLYEGVDEDLLDRIANPQVDAEVLEVKARAISERTVRNAFAVSDVGEISNVDAVPQAADELMALEGVTAVVVVGEKDGTLHLSGRSRDDRVHMGKALEYVVEDIPRSDAGGHARMGGGQVSMRHMEAIGPSGGISRPEFHDRLFDAMAGDV